MGREYVALEVRRTVNQLFLVSFVPGEHRKPEFRVSGRTAKCGVPHGAGWYVFAVEGDTPRQLTDAEDKLVNEFRFGAQVI